MKIAVVAQFKNEAMGIREWMEHYIWQGVDKVCLIDDSSSDNYREKLNGLESYFEVFPGDPYSQHKNYNRIGLPWLKKNGIDVVLITDLDEFWFGRNGNSLRTHIESIFKEKPQTGPSACYARWHIFGSNGHVHQPQSIREGFTMKRNKLGGLTEKKMISWVDDILELGLHETKVKGNVIECPITLQLNHYMIQSREFFEKVKMKRGDATKNKNSVRTWDYFNQQDINEIEDTALRDLVRTAAHRP